MINVAICDDDHFFCENLSSFLTIHYGDTIQTIDDFSNGTELITSLSQSETLYDFVFLDLFMPGSDGIMTGLELRQLYTHHNLMIFYITAFDSQVTTITDIHPFAYIKKPLNYTFLKQKIDAALNQSANCSKYILLNTKKTSYKLFPNDIVYFESAHHKSIAHFTDDSSLVIPISLSGLSSAILNEHTQFVRIHSSFMINLIHVEKVTHSHAYLKHNSVLPISSTYRISFFRRFREFFR